MKEPRRFWSKVDVGEPDECWEWLGFKMRQGYGQFGINYRLWLTHRVAWVLTYGPIPEGLCVLHHCDSPGCCNPYHLFLGTRTDNAEDSTRKGRRAKKLTKEGVLEIRKLYATGEWTMKKLGSKFGVSTVNISCVINRKTWNWLESKERIE